jgi:RNA polymerase sigma-70 factor, ECF subfamily
MFKYSKMRERQLVFTASDDELMQELARGDQSAFRSLFERHASRVLGYCSRFMGDSTRGEDMAQDTWMKMIKAAPQYRAEGKALSWILSIARNTCLSEIRRNNPANQAPIEEGYGEMDRTDLQTQMEQQTRIDQLKKQIEILPDTQRAALIMWVADELSYDEIASQLEMTVSAVKSLLFRARQSLEKAMKAAI